jgi:hypothetical protein
VFGAYELPVTNGVASVNGPASSNNRNSTGPARPCAASAAVASASDAKLPPPVGSSGLTV